MYNFRSVSEAYQEARKYNLPGMAAVFPPYITFELVSGCNFRCRMCALTYSRQKAEHIPLDKFMQITDQTADFGSLVRFIGYSEPLMYSHFREAVRYVKSKGLLLHITTNASLLDKSTADFIAEAGVDSLIFSFQGGSAGEYMSMRSLGLQMYEKVLENIAYMRSVRKNTSMKITTTVTSRDTEEDINKFVTELLEYADEVQVSGFTHFVHVSDHFGQSGIWDELGIKRPSEKTGVCCTLPQFEMLIKPDGSASACCGAYTDGLVYGNAFSTKLIDIWNSEKAAQIRRLTAEGKLDVFENCRVCPVKYRYDNIDNPVYNTRR